MIETLISQVQESSPFELMAVVLAIAYLLLAVREHIACWYAAFVSTLIFLFIFVDVRLYMESALQVYYLGMAVYGWYLWRKRDTTGDDLQITMWTGTRHFQIITLVVVLSVMSAWILDRYTDARLPLLDSFTTWGAVITTFMVARKVLENWVYWLVIDSVSIYLYLDRGLYFTAALFAIYIIIIVFGFAAWLKRYRAQTVHA